MFKFKFASIDDNPTEKVFEWSLEKKCHYDAFIFLNASDKNDKKIVQEMNAYRAKSDKQNAK